MWFFSGFRIEDLGFRRAQVCSAGKDHGRYPMSVSGFQDKPCVAIEAERNKLLYFPTLGVGLFDFKVSYYSSPAETTSWSAQPQQTTVRLPGVPNPNRLP